MNKKQKETTRKNTQVQQKLSTERVALFNELFGKGTKVKGTPVESV